jgi:hypothetical protein
MKYSVNAGRSPRPLPLRNFPEIWEIMSSFGKIGAERFFTRLHPVGRQMLWFSLGLKMDNRAIDDNRLIYRGVYD